MILPFLAIVTQTISWWKEMLLCSSRSNSVRFKCPFVSVRARCEYVKHGSPPSHHPSPLLRRQLLRNARIAVMCAQSGQVIALGEWWWCGPSDG